MATLPWLGVVLLAGSGLALAVIWPTDLLMWLLGWETAREWPGLWGWCYVVRDLLCVASLAGGLAALLARPWAVVFIVGLAGAGLLNSAVFLSMLRLRRDPGSGIEGMIWGWCGLLWNLCLLSWSVRMVKHTPPSDIVGSKSDPF